MNYRLATQSDARELARLRWDFRLEETGGVAKTTWEEFSVVCADFVAAGIAAGEWQFWVSDDGQRLTGCVCMRVIRKVPKPNQLDDRFGYVTNVYMRPEYRNGGHGTQLLKNAIAWARAEGIGELMGEIATPALGTGAAISPPMQREVLEETGWHVTGITPVGIWHFHHLAPRLARCRFPYPDFLNVIYRAKTTRYDAAARIADDYETGSRFIGLETLLAIRLEQPSQLVLARHAAGDS